VEEGIGAGDPDHQLAHVPVALPEHGLERRGGARVVAGLDAALREAEELPRHAALELVAREERLGQLDRAVERARRVLPVDDLAARVDVDPVLLGPEAEIAS
jgi:hypothetical protein